MPVIKIKGMSCQHCVASTTTALKALPGITAVAVDLDRGEASYEGDVEPELLAAAIEQIGFEMIDEPS